MVAWEMEVFTPEVPEGRKIVVISNDITYDFGSFSMKEHRLYAKASEYSRQHRMPRVYVSANSGARIGFAKDVKSKLNVVWNDSERPEDGFKCLNVDCDSQEDPVLDQIEYTQKDGKYCIDAIIGKEDDIGVENLVGSGLIAGETSAAYNQVPTYCLVTGTDTNKQTNKQKLILYFFRSRCRHRRLRRSSFTSNLSGQQRKHHSHRLVGPQLRVGTSNLHVEQSVGWSSNNVP